MSRVSCLCSLGSRHVGDDTSRLSTEAARMEQATTPAALPMGEAGEPVCFCHCGSLWTWRVRFARVTNSVAPHDQAGNVSVMLQDALMQRAIAKLAQVRQQRETWKQRAMQLKVICANMQTSLHTMTQLAQAAMPEGAGAHLVGTLGVSERAASGSIAAFLVCTAGQGSCVG